MVRAVRSAMIVVFALAGCERTVIVQERCDEPRAGEGLAPGERVLARYKDGFFEGTVITVQGRLVTVAWDEGSPERSWIPRGWVRSLEQPGAPRPGSWALCRPANAWELCRVEQVDGREQGDGPRVVLTSSGERERLAARRVFPLPEALRGWAGERGTELLAQARRGQLLARARPAGAGQAVKVGQRVLGEWMPDSWWEATVAKIEAAAVTVRWVDGGGEQRLQPGQVAPLESVGAGLGPEQVAYCKWASSGQWWKAFVERVSASTVHVTYSDGRKGELAAGQCVPATAERAEQAAPPP